MLFGCFACYVAVLLIISEILRQEAPFEVTDGIIMLQELA